MARECNICGKKTTISQQRKKLMSKYNPTPRKKKYPNLQATSLPGGKKVKACAKCIKALSK